MSKRRKTPTTPAYIRSLRIAVAIAVLLFLVVAAWRFLLAPDVSLTALQSGQQAYLDGSYQDAVNAFSQAIIEDSTNSEAYIGRGIAYVQLGQLDAAQVDFERAITLDPEDTRSYDQLGLMALNQGNYQQAIDYYDQVITIAGADGEVPARAYFNRGMAYFRIPDYERAVIDFERATERNTTEPLYFLRLGDTYYALERYGDALVAYEQYLSLENPDLIAGYVQDRVEGMR